MTSPGSPDCPHDGRHARRRADRPAAGRAGRPHRHHHRPVPQDARPQAFCFHRGERLEIVTAQVSAGVHGGTPGRIFYREGDGVVIVAGADARRGRNHALLVTGIRTPDGGELPAGKYLTHMGGYLTSHP